MKRLAFSLVFLAGFFEAFACSPGEAQYRYDTLETGALRLVRIENYGTPQNPRVRTDTLGVYHQGDLEVRLRGFLKDSALTFIGRFDSLSLDSVAPHPSFAMDTTPFMRNYTVHLRLQVDTVLRGTFPLPRPVWLRLREGFGSCGVPFRDYLNRPFLNASIGFSGRADLKLQFSPFGFADFWYNPFPGAMWFSGRYLQDPKFPHIMRLDITRILSDYPATGITPRRLSPSPLRPTGKAWLPNGRAAGPRDARRNPVPAVR